MSGWRYLLNGARNWPYHNSLVQVQHGTAIALLSDESLPAVEDGVGPQVSMISNLEGEKRELREIRVCICDQWQTFPCDLITQCQTCQTRSICQDCGGCRWCWWLTVTDQVPAIEVEGGHGDGMPF